MRETTQNESSSRSHQVVTIFIESRSIEGHPTRPAATGSAPAPLTSSVLNSTLTFVDLAGSEPPSASDAPLSRPSTASSVTERQRLLEVRSLPEVLLEVLVT